MVHLKAPLWEAALRPCWALQKRAMASELARAAAVGSGSREELAALLEGVLGLVRGRGDSPKGRNSLYR